jgi:hypothetical protein
MRARRIRRVGEHMEAAAQAAAKANPAPEPQAQPMPRANRDQLRTELLPQATGEEHHQISVDTRNPIALTRIAAQKTDPALKACC